MTTILDYFGLFRIISIWNRDSHLHEAVGGGHHLQAADGFPKYLLIAKTSLFGFGRARCHHLAFCQINANMSG